MAGHIATAQSVERNTPEWILDLVREVFEGRIELDPCANPKSLGLVRAETSLMLPDHDGLETEWEFNTAFVNPPFGTTRIHKATRRVRQFQRGEWLAMSHKEASEYKTQTLEDWAAKMRASHAVYDTEIIGLTPANVDTAVWQKHLRRAAVTCFLEGRVTFLDGETGEELPACAPMPIALTYFGRRPSVFAKVFRNHGIVAAL